MKIYDISQEILNCNVYEGDPCPKRDILASLEQGDVCNLSALSICVHNGTHIDAPYHFYDDGKTVDDIALEKTVGDCYVAKHDGIVDEENALKILKKADNVKRILIKGNAEVSLEAAKIFAQAGLDLLGNESQTVGPLDAPMAVHKELLSADVVLLEGVRLEEVPEGRYFLNAAPINIKGSDGSPCRAILIEE